MPKPVQFMPVNLPLIRHIIESRKLRYQDVAAELGVSPTHFHDMLSGTRTLQGQEQGD